MPIYEYVCKKCKKKFEILQSNHEPLRYCSEATSECDEDGELQKLISSFSVNNPESSKEFPCEHGGCGMAEHGGCQGFCGM